MRQNTNLMRGTEVLEKQIELMMGNCLELMKEMPDQSVDMVLCDLPYGTTACAWDSVIPFDLLWNEYQRVTKPNAAVVLTASQPFTSMLVMSNIKMFRHEWVWKKNRGSNFASLKTNPFKEHESVVVFSKNAPTFNAIRQARSESGASRAKYDFKNEGGGEAIGVIKGEGRRTIDALLRHPSSVQSFNTEVGLHPTQKPVALMEYLICTYTNHGDTVMDNCMGSGTTGVACMNTGRNFIGMEQDAKYFKIAEQRIYDAMPMPDWLK